MIYLDNAATTFPKPPQVTDAVAGCMNEYCGNPGRSSHRLSLRAAEAVYGCREMICSLFGSDKPECVIFTLNATQALNIAIKSLIRCGDHVLISNIEHNSVIRPITALACIGVTYSTYNAFPDGNEESVLASLNSKLRPDTHVVIASHRSNICGLELPVTAIGRFCAEHGLIFIIDAAQSAGNCELDIGKTGADAICAPGHKGLYGPQGSGFVLFADKYAGEGAAALDTFIEGGNGVNSLELSMPAFLPERLEAGTLATPAIAGLAAGIDYVANVTPQELFAAESRLCRRTAEMLGNTRHIKLYATQVRESSLLLFNVAGISCNTVAAALDSHGICVRGGFHCSPLAHAALGTGENGAVRVSFGIFNSDRDIDIFYRSLREILFGTK